jgi:hypothetical protein
MVLWNPVNSAAFGKLTEIFQQVQGAFVQLFIRVDTPHENDSVPDQDYTVMDETRINSINMSLEDAQKNTLFDIKIPTYLPEGFELESVVVIKRDNQKSEEIYLQYEDDERSFIINEKIISDSIGVSIISDQDDTLYEEITIKDQPANLIYYKDGNLNLVWVISNYYYIDIKGQLTKDEIIKIANSMQ